MLVIVEDGDRAALLELLLDLKAAGCRDVLEVYTAERAFEKCYSFNYGIYII